MSTRHLVRDGSRAAGSRSRTTGTARVLLAFAWLVLAVACDEPELPVATWRIATGGLGEQTVRLPTRIVGPRREGSTYELTADVALPRALRGEALELVLPAFDGVIALEVDGAPATPSGYQMPSGYRQPGPHRWLIDAAHTAGDRLALRLIVQYRWLHSAWFPSAPRLLRPGAQDGHTWAMVIFNGLAALLSIAALVQISVSATAVYLVDRTRKAYLLFGIQTVSALVYPLHVLGISQYAGHWDVIILGLGLIVATTGSVYFTHTFFGLAPPNRWVLRLGVTSGALQIAAGGPFSTFAGPPVTAYLMGLTLYQVYACTRLVRHHADRRSAGYLLLSWIGLVATITPDVLAWVGVVDALHGVRIGVVGLIGFAFWLSLLFSQRHITSLGERDRLNTELASRVGQLENRRTEIEQLNDELRRQIAERSAQIFAALALAGAADAPKRLAIGEQIAGRYRVERKLGVGGMGEVYEVTRLADGRLFALKLALESSGAALARLAREAQAACQVRHDNIVSVIDVDVADTGFLYIVMELVEGDPLSVSDIAHDPALAFEVLRQIADGLAALHAVGVVHRDLKPANVLVTRHAATGQLCVKITDFGIALPGMEALMADLASDEHALAAARASAPRAADAAPGAACRAASDAGSAPAVVTGPRGAPSPSTVTSILVEVPGGRNGSTAPRADAGHASPGHASPGHARSSPLTGTGFIPGTPAYIAPELAGSRANLGPAADMFSFGVLAHELLTGARPFAEPAILAALSGHPVSEPPSIDRARPELPLTLAAVVASCLSLSPERRPSARAVAHLLGELTRARS